MIEIVRLNLNYDRIYRSRGLLFLEDFCPDDTFEQVCNMTFGHWLRCVVYRSVIQALCTLRLQSLLAVFSRLLFSKHRARLSVDGPAMQSFDHVIHVAILVVTLKCKV